MKNIILSLALLSSVVLGVGASTVSAVPVPTVNVGENCTTNGDAGTTICNSTKNVDSVLQTVVDTMLIFLGVVSVVVVIIGGIRYVTSGGDSKSAGQARSMILYAIIGLVVAFLAYAIVNWVVTLKL